MSIENVQEAVVGSATPSVPLADQIGRFTTRLTEIAEDMKQSKEDDTARYDTLKAEQATVASSLTELKAAHDKQVRDAEVDAAIEAAKAWQAALPGMRTPAKSIGAGRTESVAKRGDFIGNVGKDFYRNSTEEQAEGKAALSALTDHEESFGKATLGTTDAAGGWIIPNAQVAEFVKPARIKNPYRELMNVIDGVTGFAVDMPFRAALPTPAVIAAFGATKENVDLAYNGYTATMYTLARIHDISNQFLRQSAGAAEQDVLQELGTAFALGEANYIREGTGSSQPFGFTPALTNGPAAFRTTFTPSAATLAGSILTAIATAAGDLAGRGRTPDGAVLAATVYWQMASQGLDAAGFFYAPANGPRDIRPNTLLTPWGLPVYPDASANIQGTAAVVDNLVVAEWKAFKLFFGQNYRVESSDQAGTRWDANLTGFRGEEEMGFDARPAVYSGAAQLVTDVTP